MVAAMLAYSTSYKLYKEELSSPAVQLCCSAGMQKSKRCATYATCHVKPRVIKLQLSLCALLERLHLERAHRVHPLFEQALVTIPGLSTLSKTAYV